MSTATHRPDTNRPTQLVQIAAGLVAATFLAVGILGFVPGITSNADNLDTHGPGGSGGHAELLGIFGVSVLHNLVHIGFGLAGLALARRVNTATAYLTGGGLVYGLVALYGMAVDENSTANFLPVNTADNWLHLALAIAMIALGTVLGRRGALKASP